MHEGHQTPGSRAQLLRLWKWSRALVVAQLLYACPILTLMTFDPSTRKALLGCVNCDGLERSHFNNRIVRAMGRFSVTICMRLSNLYTASIASYVTSITQSRATVVTHTSAEIGIEPKTLCQDLIGTCQ